MALLFGRKKRRGDSVIEDISMKMMFNPENAPDPAMAVSDSEILEDLEHVPDIEATDRDGRTLLINAAFYGREEIVKYLIEKGANIAATDKDGYTALHAAAQEGFAVTAEMLIKNGADINAADSNGNTPLLIARHRAVIELLSKNGADPHLKNNMGISAADMFENYPDILSLFD